MEPSKHPHGSSKDYSAIADNYEFPIGRNWQPDKTHAFELLNGLNLIYRDHRNLVGVKHSIEVAVRHDLPDVIYIHVCLGVYDNP